MLEEFEKAVIFAHSFMFPAFSSFCERKKELRTDSRLLIGNLSSN